MLCLPGPSAPGRCWSSSRLVLGTNSAVSGAPSSWEVQGDSESQLPQCWGKQLSGTLGLFGHLLPSPTIISGRMETPGEVLSHSDPTGLQRGSMGDPRLEICLSQGKAGTGGGSECVINGTSSSRMEFSLVMAHPRDLLLSNAFQEAPSGLKKLEGFCSERLLRSFTQILLPTLGWFALTQWVKWKMADYSHHLRQRKNHNAF